MERNRSIIRLPSDGLEFKGCRHRYRPEVQCALSKCPLDLWLLLNPSSRRCVQGTILILLDANLSWFPSLIAKKTKSDSFTSNESYQDEVKTNPIET